MISAVAPVCPEEGDRRHTTVASAYGSPRSVSSPASRRTSAAETPAFAAWIASQTLADVSGMSMLRTPSGHSASITAFT